MVREGNPGKRPVREAVRLPAAELVEPDWSGVFPVGRGTSAAVRGEAVRCRNVARREWRRVVPVLTRTSGLADVDEALVRDYCVVVARIDQCERALSRDGLLMLGERGWQKNGRTTIAAQYRQQLRAYVGELGLSPSSRITAGDDDDDGDVFD